MSIVLMIFGLNVFAAFVLGITGHSFWCGVNVVLAVLMAFLAMAYEGRLINRIQKLEREIDDLKKENDLWLVKI